MKCQCFNADVVDFFYQYFIYLFFFFIFFNSRMFTLTENKTTGLWEDKEICFGDDKYCTNKLSGEFERYILSFGEDEGGIVINYLQFSIIRTYCYGIDRKTVQRKKLQTKQKL